MIPDDSKCAGPALTSDPIVPAPAVAATVANPGAEVAQVAFPVVDTIAGAATAHAVLRISGADQGARVPVITSGAG